MGIANGAPVLACEEVGVGHSERIGERAVGDQEAVIGIQDHDSLDCRTDDHADLTGDQVKVRVRRDPGLQEREHGH